ncbi:hypothetical protein [Brevibacillus borstelensis]|uniref:hypothetical protein n=1 Tax=Brevibacillus borstelensis TaxID=45462 RepID=UPI000469B1A7|nr:hypothetical protein [Brevibacillus borstelensis]
MNAIGNNFLLDEAPLVILPSLAVRIGLNEAIVIQQLHYWLQKSTNIRDRRKWVYNTYKEWQEQFPFWSEITVRRILTSLENKGFIKSEQFNRPEFDNTKWYTLIYELLPELVEDDIGRRETRWQPTDRYKRASGRMGLSSI